jgi:hypothetical protein
MGDSSNGFNVRFVLGIALVGCGGAPFDADPPDAGLVVAVHDATARDSPSMVDASPIGAAHEASGLFPEAAADPPDVCAPVIVTPPADGGPVFAGCIVNATLSSIVPAFYAVLIDGSCALERTPLACQCASTYSCACLKANTTLCDGACDESGGAPIVSCK